MREDELEEIKREIVESRSLTIKTNNLVNALAGDMKSIAKRQQTYERRILVNSATAYVVTVLALLFVLKFAWDARVDSVETDTRQVRSQVERLQAEIKACQAREEAEGRAHKKAGEFYALMQAEKRQELIEKYSEVNALPLTTTERAVFDSAAERARDELSLMAYQTGLEHSRAGRFHEAEQAFSDALGYKGRSAHTPQITYERALALRALGKQRDAIPLLESLATASADKEVIDDALLLLAYCQLDIQAWNDAKNSLRQYIRRFPKSAHVNDAKAKLAEAELYH